MELYIIRHAQSTNNLLEDSRLRVVDPPLTELGEQQAELVAQRLAFKMGDGPDWKSGYANENGYGLTKLYCSAMWRSLQTAGAIARATGLKPEIWLEVHEQGGMYLDHGDERGVVGYPGVSRQDILAEYPECILPETVTDAGWYQGSYEEWSGCYQRAETVAARLHEWADSDERIGIVTHGAFIAALIKTLLGQSVESDYFFVHHNTALSRVDFVKEGRLRFHYLNRVDHLPIAMIS